MLSTTAPAQPRRLDRALLPGDGRIGPGRAVVDLVDRRDDPGRTGLRDMGQRDRICIAIPAEALLHLLHTDIPCCWTSVGC